MVLALKHIFIIHKKYHEHIAIYLLHQIQTITTHIYVSYLLYKDMYIYMKEVGTNTVHVPIGFR